jgi:hypothetical protein
MRLDEILDVEVVSNARAVRGRVVVSQSCQYQAAYGLLIRSSTGDPAMQAMLREHPGLRWKALNVKKRLGVAVDDEEAPA